GDIQYQSGSIGTIRSGNGILLNPGFHAMQGSQLRVYTSLDVCNTLPELLINENVFESKIVSTIKSNLDINVYPNPSTDHITIEFAKNNIFESVYITDNYGKKVLTKNIDNNNLINLNIIDLPQGIYYLYFVNSETI